VAATSEHYLEPKISLVELGWKMDHSRKKRMMKTWRTLMMNNMNCQKMRDAHNNPELSQCLHQKKYQPPNSQQTFLDGTTTGHGKNNLFVWVCLIFLWGQLAGHIVFITQV
jgi:hypothetical protein